MSLVDTKERIFRDGQIYSRPRFGGPVGSPDTRQFTPDPNPYGVEPEPRGFGGSMFQIDPMIFLNQSLEQNKEVMGPKEQIFPRFADPGDGVLKNPMMVAEVPGFGPEIPGGMVGDVTEGVIPGYKDRRDALRRKILGMLRGA
jgi:hypothetical protein